MTSVHFAAVFIHDERTGTFYILVNELASSRLGSLKILEVTGHSLCIPHDHQGVQ